MNEIMAGEWLFKAKVRDNSGEHGVLFAQGETVPADAATGYATGCLFTKLDNADHSDLLYANIGDASSANFNLVTVASD